METERETRDKLKAMFLNGELPYHLMVMEDGEVLQNPKHPLGKNVPQNTRPPLGLYALVAPVKEGNMDKAARVVRKVFRAVRKFWHWVL